jgi:tetratricopeptide (TPR) repeat protein
MGGKMTQTGGDANGRDGVLKGWLIFISGLAVGAGVVVALLVIVRPQPVKDLQLKRLVAGARQLIDQRDYEEALKSIEQVLALDPDNDFAAGVRHLVEDRAVVAQARMYREQYGRNTRPATTTPEDAAQQAALAQLERKLPEAHFENIGFADTVDFFRDITSADIAVDWNSLESAGISRDQPVSANMKDIKFATALDLILRDLGGKHPVGYTVDEGVIMISALPTSRPATAPAAQP